MLDTEPRPQLARFLHGRRKIFSAVDNITAENVLKEVNNALRFHYLNIVDEDYLYWYRKGVQPILLRTKEIRPEICNQIVVNNAEQVVTFKNGFFLQKPISYVSRKEDEAITEKVRELNEYLYVCGKSYADNEIVNWFHTVGLATLYVEPNNEADSNEKPVNVFALDPRSAFVVYSMRPGNKPVMGINVVVTDEAVLFDVYTKDKVFRLSAQQPLVQDITVERPRQLMNGTLQAMTIDSVEPNIIGLIPIIEYQYNECRTSAFEPAIGIMDAINLVESNRADGIEQMIQQLCVAYNCRFEEGVTANEIRQAGMLQLKSTSENKADFQILSSGIDQAQTQVTLDDLYEQMLNKCSMPSTSKGGTSTSDTGTAVYLRDGFQIADTAARNTTDLFEQSNRRFDEVFLKILEIRKGFKLSLNDFAMRIERNSASNLLSKSQTAMNLKQLGLAPQIVFERSGISSDPLNDIEVSQKYIDATWTTEKPMETIPSANEEEAPTTPQEAQQETGNINGNETKV